MKINLADVSINFSAKLPEVLLEIPSATLDLTSNMATVHFKHSIPLHIPNQPETFALIEDGTLELPIPPEFLEAIRQFYLAYAADKYGYGD
jgi:hypothetical protein